MNEKYLKYKKKYFELQHGGGEAPVPENLKQIMYVLNQIMISNINQAAQNNKIENYDTHFVNVSVIDNNNNKVITKYFFANTSPTRGRESFLLKKEGNDNTISVGNLQGLAENLFNTRGIVSK